MKIGPRMILCLGILASLIIAVSPGPYAAELKSTPSPNPESKTGPTVQTGKRVGIEYTIVLDDGSTVDTNVGEKPFVFSQGDPKILPALQSVLEGLKVGDRKHITLPPEKAYGPVKQEAFQEVSSTAIPKDSRKVGALLATEDQDGNKQEARVHEVKENTVVIDLNHPLAGKTLTFDIRVVEIK